MQFLTFSSDGQIALSDGSQSLQLTKEQADHILSQQCPVPKKSPQQLESAILRLLEQLFDKTDTHNVTLDGNEIGVTEGSHPNQDYLHYINGHTRCVTNDCTIYTCLTYLTSIEMEEQVILKDGMITCIMINTFNYAGIQTSGPGSPDWHTKLAHIHDLLKSSVRRWSPDAFVSDDSESDDV